MTGLRSIDAFLRIPPDDRQVVGAINRLHRILALVSNEVPFHQILLKLNRRASLFDEFRDKLRSASSLPENESEEGLNAMRENFKKWIPL